MIEKFRSILANPNTQQILRYGAVTIASYVVLLTATYVLVSKVELNPTLGYGLALTGVYVLVYISSSLFVFKTSLSKSHASRFAVAILGMWFLNTAVFHILESYFNIYYLAAAIINIVVFGPLRYFTHRLWVFK